jgi:drug/metabolite transporter (DMT)-like permease
MEQLRGNREYGRSVLFAVAAAALFACSTPLSKILLHSLPPILLAGLLYLGAGVGAVIVLLVSSGMPAGAPPARLFARRDLPYVLGMVLLDILAPVLLLFGLRGASASGAALLNNFEIVATALFALLLFRETISRRLWIAIALITVSSCLLTFDAGEKVAFSAGSVLVLLAAVCWGLENNCTRKLADKNPIRIVAVKGLCSGAGALIIGLFAGERFGGWGVSLLAMLAGCFAYGMSIACYIRAQRTLGAAKTSAYYAAAPFIGSALSFLLLGERPNGLFLVALMIMLAGAYFATIDKPQTLMDNQ